MRWKRLFPWCASRRLTIRQKGIPGGGEDARRAGQHGPGCRCGDPARHKQGPQAGKRPGRPVRLPRGWASDFHRRHDSFSHCGPFSGCPVHHGWLCCHRRLPAHGVARRHLCAACGQRPHHPGHVLRPHPAGHRRYGRVPNLLEPKVDERLVQE